jgi:8-oxo-dGTP pyrophosphatase MutT (NUDIX family)
MADSNLAKDAAFGVVPILHTDSAYQFLLIQHHAGHWGFPKGHADPGESDVQAACREFTEETGIDSFTLLEGVSFSEQYTFTREGRKYEKTVVYYPAFVQSPIVKYQKAEIRDFAWVAYDAAIARLTFGGARQVLAAVQQYLTQQASLMPQASHPTQPAE